MSASYSRTEIIGNVGKEPEMRFTPSGTPVTNFTVAVNTRYTTQDGEKKESTEWFTVTAWRKLAEQCNQFLSKGRLVFVSGRVQIDRWTAPDGLARSRLSINANQVLFLDSPSSDIPEETGEEFDDLESDDIPF